MDKARNEILSKLIPVYSDALSACSFSNLQEIRFRADRPVMLYYSCDTAYLAKRGGKTQLREEAIFCNQADIERQVSAFCRSSQYAYQEEIRAGFLTIRGGHRIGIGGKAVVSDSGILSLTAYSSLNIRIAREYLGSASDCMHYILKEETIQNTVIISPPGVGKTTVLRDLARQLSGRFKVSLVDERGELAAMHRGCPQFDIGDQTDVLDGFLKKEGIIRALRSLSPDVIITDEIGGDADKRVICDILKGGCKIITSMHGYSIEEAVTKKPDLMSLFDTAILLQRKNGVPEVEACISLSAQ